MTVVWVLLAVGLLAFELHHFAFYALFGAVGALAAAGVAAAAPHAYGLQGLVAAVVAILGIVFARPFVSRALRHGRGSGHVAHGVHGGLVGQQVRTLDDVGDTDRPGHVRLSGENWLAVSGIGSPIAAGTPVLVTGVRGTTLLVVPLDELGITPSS